MSQPEAESAAGDGPSVREDPVFGRFNRLFRLTHSEDERGLVLKLCSFAEQALGALLLDYLRPGKAARELLEGFNAPLGTFSARTKAGFAIGLLSDEQAHDLDLARKIRNEFAHNWEGCSFETPKIRSWAQSMSHSRISEKRPKDAKEHFQESMICILIELTALGHELTKKNGSVPVVARHLRVGPAEPPRAKEPARPERDAPADGADQ